MRLRNEKKNIMSKNIDRLVEVMARLRDPKGGCPWDIEQTFASIAPNTIEETYELVEAIEGGNAQAIKEELGDVLLQVVFHAQMASEAGMFDIENVAECIANKMIERHPHIFGEREGIKTAGDVLVNWEADKAAKREAKGEFKGALDGVSFALPAATRAVKLQKRAARVGFDWDNARDVLGKIREEIGELEAELSASDVDDALVREELGDVFFAITNLARKLDVDPETALRGTNRKFERRFSRMEKIFSTQGRTIADASLDEMEAMWDQVKREERGLE